MHVAQCKKHHEIKTSHGPLLRANLEEKRIECQLQNMTASCILGWHLASARCPASIGPVSTVCRPQSQAQTVPFAYEFHEGSRPVWGFRRKTTRCLSHVHYIGVSNRLYQSKHLPSGPELVKLNISTGLVLAV